VKPAAIINALYHLNVATDAQRAAFMDRIERGCTRTMWNPNSNLDLGVDFLWSHIDTANSGIASLPAQGGRPATTGGSLAAPNATWYNITNYEVYQVAIRAQYNFLP
jgi:hypothetical protein